MTVISLCFPGPLLSDRVLRINKVLNTADTRIKDLQALYEWVINTFEIISHLPGRSVRSRSDT